VDRGHDGMPVESEPRFETDLLMRVFGMDADSRPFFQSAHARNISDRGARFCGLEKRLTPGDIIGVQFGSKKARCKVMWVSDGGPVEKIETGVIIVAGQPCPWREELETQRDSATAPASRTNLAANDQRQFPRHQIHFQIEIDDGLCSGVRMNTKTADIGGGGCYIETMIPFPVRKLLTVTFWLNSKRIHTAAIVRTSDGGVGMGIEFTGLDEATRKQLQQQVESMAAEAGAAPFSKAQGAP
jgi:hypothetical protein